VLVGGGAARVVGVAGSRSGHEPFGGLLGIDLPRVHHRRPVLPVPVLNTEHQGRSEGASIAQPSRHLHRVLLDPLATAAAEAVLASFEPAVDLPAIDLHAGGEALEDRRQTRSVGFAAGEQAQFSHATFIQEKRDEISKRSFGFSVLSFEFTSAGL
jgi:hypothetical protein